jgi:multiple sugar transport system permease protein
MTAITTSSVRTQAQANAGVRHQLAAGSVYVLLIVLALLAAFPFFWVLLMSTHTRTEIFSSPPPFSFGGSLVDNYWKLLKIMDFWLVLWNSVTLSVIGTVASILFCAASAYGLVAFDFRGKRFVFALIVGSMMIPQVLTIIPFFLTAKFLGLLDTHTAIWLPMAADAFGIFLMRQYMATVLTRDLRDAAIVDGASHFRIFRSVAMPLSLPAIATLGIVMFIKLWNNFMIPLVILSSHNKQVLTLALRSVQSLVNTEWGAVMLGVSASMLPLIVCFLFFSRQMIAGLTAGAVKG